MNKRIRQLALQAMTYVTHNPKANKLNSGDMFDEKFAELIVRECIELNKQELAFNAFERMLNRYKEHFGVEE